MPSLILDLSDHDPILREVYDRFMPTEAALDAGLGSAGQAAAAWWTFWGFYARRRGSA